MLSKKLENGAVVLRWGVNASGYEIRKPTSQEIERYKFSDGARVKNFIFPKAPLRPERYEAVLGDSDIFLHLINAAANENGLLEFAGKFGLLKSLRFQSVDESLNVRNNFGDMFANGLPSFDEVTQNFSMKGWDGYGVVGNAALIFETAHSRGARTRLYWSVQYLEDYLRCEVLTEAGGSSRIAYCESCRKFYSRRAVKGPAPDYCSNACKQKAYRKRQTQSAR
jgi:hypothetical protein